MKKVNNQKGTVLILALLLLVMVEVILVSLLSYHHFGIMYTKDLKKHAQTMELMLGGEKWAIGLLKQIKIKDLQQFQYTLNPTETPWGVIQGQVWDAQALVNLNNFQNRDPAELDHYLSIVLNDFADDKEALVQYLAPSELGFQSTQTLAYPQNMNDKEDNTAANLPLEKSTLLYSITELLTQTSISTAGFTHLLPFMTVLPEYTGLNVNTALKESLYSLNTQMSQPQVEAILALRQEKELTSLDDFINTQALKEVSFTSNDIVFKSDYFLAEISVIQEEETMKLYTLMKVVENDTSVEIEVLWRSLGTR